LFSLRYANYPRDLFMGILPSSQLGSVATVDVSTSNSFLLLRNLQSGVTVSAAANSLNPLVLKQDGRNIHSSNRS
jgi:hypothetical protein